jgi:hypothetical protein
VRVRQGGCSPRRQSHLRERSAACGIGSRCDAGDQQRPWERTVMAVGFPVPQGRSMEQRNSMAVSADIAAAMSCGLRNQMSNA